MADPDFPDPGFPDLNFPFLTQALHRHCVDTNGRDDFDCDADWNTSYFERNQPYFPQPSGLLFQFSQKRP